MRQLKSLKQFEKETNPMNSSQQKNVVGGGIHRWWEVTTYTDGDRVEMAREGTWDGGKWVWSGPAYATGRKYIYVG